MSDAATKTEPVEVPDAVEKARNSAGLTSKEVSEAMDWMMDPEPEAISTRFFEINVSGDADNPKWIRWGVQRISRERIQTIREQANKRGGKQGEDTPDNTAMVNLRIATEGTIEPDLKNPAILQKYADPADALKDRFDHKPGLIDQISGEVLSAAGYDDDDLRKVGKIS